jgi:hypothetical protein
LHEFVFDLARIALIAWLVQRVWNYRGRIAWGILLALTALTLATGLAGLISVTSLPGMRGSLLEGSDLLSLVLIATEGFALLSPAVRAHVRRLPGHLRKTRRPSGKQRARQPRKAS